MLRLKGLGAVLRWLPVLAIFLCIPLNAFAMEGEVTRFTLSNGLKIIVKEDHARKVVSLQIWVLVGSADETASERGISHLIEHMAFKGTKRRGVGQIATEVETLGGEINAYTSWDETVFYVTVPSLAVSQGLDILTDAVLRPAVDPGELAKEKEVVLEEILEGEERPGQKASKLLFKTAYGKSPYRYPVIGYKDVVEKFTREDVIAFRKKWYVPDNMFLLIVGDVDPLKIRAEIERLTTDIKPVPFFRPPRPVEPVQEKMRSALIRDDNARETRLHMAFHIPSIQGVDVNPLDLAADILGSRESSRLVRVLKNEKRLVNSISAYSLTPKKPGLFVISATLDAKNLEAAAGTVMEELASLRKTPASDDELQRAKINIESDHVYALETVGGTARSIGSFEADAGDALYEAKYLKLNAAVTAQGVSKVIGKYLTPPNLTLTVLLPKDKAPDFRMEKLVDALRPFAGPEAESGKAASSDRVLTSTLPNGIRVVLSPDNSNPVLSFRLACRGGKRFETKETEGIMNFVAKMLTKGAGKMSEMEIYGKIEDMGGRLEGFSGYDSFGLSAQFFSRYLDEGLGLLAEIYNDPTLPKEEMERERALIINRIETEPDRPVPFAIKNLNETLFPRHPYGFDKEGTISTVTGFTRDDLMETYRRYAVPANTVIAVVGAMDADKALKRITELFGKIPAKPLEKPVIPAEEPLTKVTDKTVRIPRAKAHLAIGFRGTTVAGPERYPLAVLNNVLAGQGGRLFTELRDKESLAYIVTSFVRPGLDPGLFAFYIACDTGKADQALDGLFREIYRIRNAPVTEEELKRSITNLIGTYQIALQSSWARAESTGLNTLYGLGYDYDVEYVKKISQVKANQITEAARKFLDPRRCVIVKILPEESKK